MFTEIISTEQIIC